MSNTEATRKRKAERISPDDSTYAANDDDEDGTRNAIPHLPAPVWGHVLDFMPYTEVRSALRVGKHIAVEAAKYVQTLNIMKCSQMYIPAARRFANAEEVNVLCLLKGTGELLGSFVISSDTANRTATFLSCFAKLKRIFLGGYTEVLNGDEAGQKERRQYFASICNGPDNHEEIFRGLIRSLLGALKTGAIPRGLIMQGCIDSLSHLKPCGPEPIDDELEEHERSCTYCREICAHFPMESLLNNWHYLSGICVRHDEFLDIIHSRPEHEKAISDASGKWLISKMSSLLEVDVLEGPKDLIQELVRDHSLDDDTTVLRVVFLWDEDFDALDLYIDSTGFDPTQVRFQEALREWRRWRIGSRIGRQNEPCFWAKSTIENLAARGFPFDCTSIPTVDDQRDDIQWRYF